MNKKQTIEEEIGLQSDEVIVTRILNGERDLQTELYNRYKDKIYGQTFLLLKDKDLTKDIVHDVFIKIFTQLSAFKNKSKFSFWVYSIARNETFNFLNKNKKTLQSDDGLDQIVDQNTVEENFTQIKLQDLNQKFSFLTPADQKILLLQYQQSLSIKEISEILQIKESATKMRLKRAKNSLYKLINNG